MTRIDRIARGLLQSMKFQLDRCCYNDVVINIDGHMFKCHRFILASASDFFRALFSSGMRDSTSNEVPIHDIEKDIFEIVYNFIYTGDIELNDENIIKVWHAANQLHVELLLQECELYQTKTLVKETCVETFIHAKALSCHNLINLSWELILKEFGTIRKGQDFLNLEADDMVKLVASDDLIVGSEDDVLEAVWKWLLKDKASRILSLDKILLAARAPLASSLAISKMTTSMLQIEGIQTNKKAVNILQEALFHQSQLDRRHDFFATSAKVRQTSDFKNVLACLVHTNGSSTLKFRSLDGHWFTGTSIDTSFSKGTLVPFGDVLYAQSWTSGCQSMRFDTKTNAWSWLPRNLNNGVKYNLIAEGDYLYSIGGPTNVTVERFNAQKDALKPGTEKWEKVSDLNLAVTNIALLSVKNTILVFGRKADNPEETVVQQVDLDTKQCSQTLEGVISPAETSVGFRYKDKLFLLQSDGSLWLITCCMDKKIEMSLLACLWELELDLHGATVSQGCLHVLATLKDSPDLVKKISHQKDFYFSDTVIFNRTGSSLVHTVLPKKFLNVPDTAFVEPVV